MPSWTKGPNSFFFSPFIFLPFFVVDVFQMELQDDGITMGLEHSISKDIISIVNNVFQAPWGGSHTCQKDEKAIECSLCQASILCYQLACELLGRLAPKEESRLVVSVGEGRPPLLECNKDTDVVRWGLFPGSAMLHAVLYVILC